MILSSKEVAVHFSGGKLFTIKTIANKHIAFYLHP